MEDDDDIQRKMEDDDDIQRKMADVRREIDKEFADCQRRAKDWLEEMTQDALRSIESQQSMEVIDPSASKKRRLTGEQRTKMEGKVSDMKELHNQVREKLRPLNQFLDGRDLRSKDRSSEGWQGGKDAISPKETEKQDKALEEVLEKDAVKKMEKEYESLPVELKMCLLCFSIFPVDKMIEKKVLIYWWIGEGFATATASKSAEKVAEDHFGELKRLGFILPVYNRRRGNVLRCRLHPCIRWFIIKMSREECFFDLDEKGTPSLHPSKSQRACLITENKDGLLEYPYCPKSKEPTPRTPPPLTENPCCPKSKKPTPRTPPPLTENPDCPKSKEPTPRTPPPLTVFNVNVKCLKLKLDKDSLPKFKSLVVLQLGRWVGSHNDHAEVSEKDPEKNDNLRQHIEIDEPEILDKLGSLLNLRYLSLRGMSRITRLPKWIGACRRLQILDLRGCQNLDELTEDIKSLERLTHLDVSECYMLEYMPKALTHLYELEVLKGFVVGGSTSPRHACKIADLTNLTKMRKLSIRISNLVGKSKDLIDLKKIESLEILAITWSGNSLKDFTLPRNLVKLDLRCFPGTELVRLLQPRNQEKLQKLYIRGGELQSLGLEEYGKIKKLRLKYLKSLKLKENDINALCKTLGYLEIYGCPEIKLSYPFDHEGVWVNDDPDRVPSTPGASSTTTPDSAPEGAPPSGSASVTASAASLSAASPTSAAAPSAPTPGTAPASGPVSPTASSEPVHASATASTTETISSSSVPAATSSPPADASSSPVPSATTDSTSAKDASVTPGATPVSASTAATASDPARVDHAATQAPSTVATPAPAAAPSPAPASIVAPRSTSGSVPTTPTPTTETPDASSIPPPPAINPSQ